MNKNISIWRGSETPPTLSHIWVKEGAILIYINEEWKPITDPELYEKITLDVSSTLTNFQSEINQSLENQSNELKNYTDEKATIQNLDLKDITKDFDDNKIYRIINYNNNSNYPILENSILKNNQLCYFEKTNELEDSCMPNVIEFNTKYYHLLFAHQDYSFEVAITETNSGVINDHPRLSNSQLWRFIGSPSCFVLQSRSGKFLKGTVKKQQCTTTEDKKEATLFKLVHAEGTNRFYIVDYKQSLLLNPLGGAGIGYSVGYWDAYELSNAIKISNFEYYKSNELTNYWYNIYFINSKSYLCLNGTDVIADSNKKDQWQFIPNGDKVYIRHKDGLYLSISGDKVITSEQGYLFNIDGVKFSTRDVCYWQIESNNGEGIDINNLTGVISLYKLIWYGITNNTQCQLELVEHDEILKCVSLNEPHPLYYEIPPFSPTATLELL